MASEDVIELGSSDDEPEPASKKPKPPVPNAMVHIPKSTPGLSLHSKKIAHRKSIKAKPILQKNINPFATKVSAVSSVSIPIKNANGSILKNSALIQVPTIAKANTIVNPVNLLKNLNNSQLQIKKVTPSSSFQKINKLNTVQGQKSVNKLPNIPPGITITRKSPNVPKIVTLQTKRPAEQIIPRKIVGTNMQAMKKRKLGPNKYNVVGAVLTVELDDDDTIPELPKESPQWYLKPETATPNKSVEEENNKEPCVPKFIEITIEDSPVKPIHNKHASEIGRESITVDDSPVKIAHQKNRENCTNSSGDDSKCNAEKSPHSKKKLQYPNETVMNENITDSTATNELDVTKNVEVVPIVDIKDCMPVKENEPTAEKTTPTKITVDNLPTTPDNRKIGTVVEENIPIAKNTVPIELTVDSAKDKPNLPNTHKSVLPIIIEIEDSPLKLCQDMHKQEITTNPKEIANATNINKNKMDKETNRDEEFHPVYQEFIDLCLKLEKTSDMNKIVENKVKPYYRKVPKDYTESEEFIEMVSSKIAAIHARPVALYIFIKEIVEELKLQRKVVTSETLTKAKYYSSDGNAGDIIFDENETDSKQYRQIRKLEKTMKKLQRAIHKLEEQEVDFDDEADSVYIMTDSDEGTCSKDNDKPPEKDRNALLQRYKERLVRVHAKLCQLTGSRMPSEPRVRVEARPGRPAGPARRLDRWVNKRMPAGVPTPFPDFHDVLRCVREANVEDKLGWNEADIMEEARDLFTRCGKKLQKRRQKLEWRIASSRLSAEMDPAEESEELRKKLEQNSRIASQRVSDVINKYADRQNILKLEGVEIGDKEAEESPVETDDEVQEITDNNDGNTKTNKDNFIEKNIKLNKEPIIVLNRENVEDFEKKQIINDDSQHDGQAVPQKLKTADENKSSCDSKVASDGQCMEDDSNESDTNKKALVGDMHSLLKPSPFQSVIGLISSDSDTPIAISDTMELTDESDEQPNPSDVVSIENSSYSDDDNSKSFEKNDESDSKGNIFEDISMEDGKDNDKPKKEKVKIVPPENILLISTEDDSCGDRLSENSEERTTFINLNDDALSIGDTIVEGENNSNTQKGDSNNKSPESPETLSNIAPVEDTQCPRNINKATSSNTNEVRSADNVQLVPTDSNICEEKDIDSSKDTPGMSANKTSTTPTEEEFEHNLTKKSNYTVSGVTESNNFSKICNDKVNNVNTEMETQSQVAPVASLSYNIHDCDKDSNIELELQNNARKDQSDDVQMDELEKQIAAVVGNESIVESDKLVNDLELTSGLESTHVPSQLFNDDIENKKSSITTGSVVPAE